MTRSNSFVIAYRNAKSDTEYTGRKRFLVTHPAHAKTIVVAAPKPEAAIVAAADYWGETWTSYSFYAYCDVSEQKLSTVKGMVN